MLRKRGVGAQRVTGTARPIFFSSSLHEVAEAYLPEIEHKDRKDDRETTARFRLTEMALLQTEVHQAPS